MVFEVTIAIMLANLVLVAVYFFSTIKIASIVKNKYIVADFIGMGLSYLLMMSFVTLWLLSFNDTYFFIAAVSSILWVMYYSYGTLRTIHPYEKRPANWALLTYFSVPIIWFVTREITLITLQIMLLSSLAFFVASLLLYQYCKNAVKKYALVGMFVGVISASHLPNLLAPIPLLDNITNVFTIFLPINALLAYMFFGFLQIAKNHPNEFIIYVHTRNKVAKR
ncbi:MAG: hypothetical protein HY361_03505 [Candidatus Aenigmarchaeota archaeon]|nr:hypothetical protein [Candidatus Aenigmarchaeota archaeon]